METINGLPTAQNCEELLALLRHPLPEGYADLLVRPQTLTDPPGKRLQRKRGLLRQFEAACPGWTADPVTLQNIDRAYSLERLWQTWSGDPVQLGFARRCFRSFSELGLTGVLLGDGQQTVGYSIAAVCGETGAYILALRALSSPAGTTAALYRETARALLERLPGLLWINLGWLGGRAEWQNRLSYDPLVGAVENERTDG